MKSMEKILRNRKEKSLKKKCNDPSKMKENHIRFL